MSDAEGDVAGAWRILGKRWTLPILKIVGSKQAVRFNEIERALAGISSTMLTERLLELEQEGLMSKKFQRLKDQIQSDCKRRGTWIDTGRA